MSILPQYAYGHLERSRTIQCREFVLQTLRDRGGFDDLSYAMKKPNIAEAMQQLVDERLARYIPPNPDPSSSVSFSLGHYESIGLLERMAIIAAELDSDL